MVCKYTLEDIVSELCTSNWDAKKLLFFFNEEDVKNNYIFNVPGIDTSEFYLP